MQSKNVSWIKYFLLVSEGGERFRNNMLSVLKVEQTLRTRRKRKLGNHEANDKFEEGQEKTYVFLLEIRK